MNIRTKLIPVLTALALVPMIVMGTLSYLQSKNIRTDNALKTLSSLVAEQRTQLDVVAATHQRRLKFISFENQLPQLASLGNPSPAMNDILDNAKRVIAEAEVIQVMGTDGKVLASTDRTEIGASRVSEPYFRSAMEGRTKPQVVPGAEGKLSVYNASVISTSQGPSGVVAIKTPATFLGQLSKDHNGLGETGEFTAVARSADGTLVSLTPWRFDPATTLRPSVPVAGVVDDKNFTVEEKRLDKGKDYRGEEVLAVSQYFEPFDWRITAKIDHDEAYAQIDALRNILLLITFVVFILIILVVVEITYSLTTPLVRLTRLTEKYRRGDYRERATVHTKDEIGRLALSVNEMVDELQSQRRKLQQTLGKESSEPDRDVTTLASEVTRRKRELERALKKLSTTERQVRHQALHDALTGLPNRLLFEDRVREALKRAKRRKGLIAVLFIDLDRFKVINDSLGHMLGDKVLRIVSERLLKCLREEDTIARFGGDEFIILLDGIADQDAAVAAAKKIHATIRKPFTLQKRNFHLDMSTGISVYPVDGKDAATLVRNADTALYRAKAGGGGGIKLYNQMMGFRATERMQLEDDLRKAVDAREFELYYQPICNKHGRVIAGEALVRWNHPKLGLIYPNEFIRQAEEIGVADELGHQVIEMATREAVNWHAIRKGTRVAVNVSGTQFSQSNLVADVKDVLQESGLSPKSLELEITESSAVGQVMTASSKLKDLKKMGITVALDDFGTGQSPLSYLRTLPVDVLKIDGSFVRNALEDEDDMAMIDTVIAIARSHDLRVTAEGVEIKELWHVLRKLDIDGFQGYYLSKPVRRLAFRKLLRKGKIA